MTRKISQKLRIACAVVERVGNAERSDLLNDFDKTENISQILRSGITAKLMTVEKIDATLFYQVVPDWREIVALCDIPKVAPRRLSINKYVGK